MERGCSLAADSTKTIQMKRQPQEEHESSRVNENYLPSMTHQNVYYSPMDCATRAQTQPPKVREDMFADSDEECEPCDAPEPVLFDESRVTDPDELQRLREVVMAARQEKKKEKEARKLKALNKPAIPFTVVQSLRDSACRRADFDFAIDDLAKQFDETNIPYDDWNTTLYAQLEEYTVEQEFDYIRFEKFKCKTDLPWLFFTQNRPVKIGVHFDFVKVLLLLGDPLCWPRHSDASMNFEEFKRDPIVKKCMTFWEKKNMKNFNQLYFRSYIIHHWLAIATPNGNYNRDRLSVVFDQMFYNQKSHTVRTRNKCKIQTETPKHYGSKDVDDFRVKWPSRFKPRVPFSRDNASAFLEGEAWFFHHYVLPCEFIGVNQSLLNCLKGIPFEQTPAVELKLSIGKRVGTPLVKVENDEINLLLSQSVSDKIARHFSRFTPRKYNVSSTMLMLLDRPLDSIKRTTFAQLCAERKCPSLSQRVFAYVDGVDLGFQDWNDVETWNQIIHHLVGIKLPKNYFKGKVDIDATIGDQCPTTEFDRLKSSLNPSHFFVVFKPSGEITARRTNDSSDMFSLGSRDDPDDEKMEYQGWFSKPVKSQEPTELEEEPYERLPRGTDKMADEVFVTPPPNLTFIVDDQVMPTHYLWSWVPFKTYFPPVKLPKRVAMFTNRDLLMSKLNYFSHELSYEAIQESRITGPRFLPEREQTNATVLFMMRVALFIGTLVRDETPRHRLEMLFMLVSAIPNLQWKAEEVLKRLQASLSFQYQGPPAVEETKSYLLLFKEIFLDKLCAGLFGKLGEIVTIVFAATMKKLTDFSAQQVAESIINLVIEVFTRVQNCFNEGSLAPLMQSSKTIETWLIESRFIQTQFNVLVSVNYAEYKSQHQRGVIPSTFKDTPYQPHELADKIRQLQEQVDGFVRYIVKPTLKAEIMKIRADLDFHYQNLLKILNHEPRIEPFFIYFGGQAGAGKTRITTALTQKLCEDYNLSPDGVYYYMSKANFQDGLGSMHHTIVLDDVDIMPSHDQTYMKAIIDYKSSKSVQNEAADLVKKGAIFIQPWFMFMSSNDYFARASSILPDPTAFVRRVDLYVRPLVYKDAATPIGALKPGATPFGDVLFQEYVYDKKGTPVDVGTPMELKTLYDLIRSRFDAHRRIRQPTSERCEKCFMPCCAGECERHARRREEMMDAAITLGPTDGLRSGVEPFRLEEPIVNQSADPIPKGFFEGLAIMWYYAGTVGFYNMLCILLLCFTYPIYYILRSLLVAWVIRSYSITKNALLGEIYEDLVTQWFRVRKFVFGCAVGGLGVMLAKYTVMKDSEIMAPQGMSPNNCPPPPTTELDEESRMTAVQRQDWAKSPPNVAKNAMSSVGQTWTRDDVEKAIESNLITISLNGKKLLFGLQIVEDLILFPSHLIKPNPTEQTEASLTDDTTVIRFERKGGVFVEVTVGFVKANTFDFNRELCVVHFENFPCIRAIHHMFPKTPDIQVGEFDDAYIHTLGRCVSGRPFLNKAGSHIYTVSQIETKPGDCGLPYYVRHGSAWWIIGIHIGFLPQSSRSVAAMFYTSNLRAIAKNFRVHIAEPKLIVHAYKSTWVARDPTKRSEVWSMRTHNPQFFGHFFGYCSTVADTPKTKIKLSLGYDTFLPLADKYCGPNYWSLPDFKGKMVEHPPRTIIDENGKTAVLTQAYQSPYSNAYLTTNSVQLPEELVMIALACYLGGMRNLSLQDYKEMSTWECLNGVYQSISVKGMNMATSVGPPFNVSKDKMFSRLSDGTYLMDNRIVDIWTEIEETLEQGKVPVVVSRSSLKDEPVKPGKFPRVFNVLPAAFNLAAKRIGGWKYLMRMNPQFFECFVGIDMTSAAIMPMINHFRAANPLLDKCSDFDVKALDKSFSNSMIEMVAKAVYAMSTAIGVKPVENFLMIKALRYIIHDVKGDFIMSPQNPSGYDATVEVNSVALALIYRMAWYKRYPVNEEDLKIIRAWWDNFEDNPVPDFPSLPSLNFRSCNSLAIYGDDTVFVTNDTIPETFFKDVKEISGLTLTAANKSRLDVVEIKPLEQIEFLKRTFSECDGLWKAALDKKSIIRMLLFMKHTTLGARDHQCCVISDACREAFLHGMEFYKEVTDVCKEVVAKHQLQNNPWLEIPDFYDLVDDYKSGHFTTFFKRADLENCLTIDEVGMVFQSNPPKTTMTSINGNYESTDSAPATTQIETHLTTFVTPVDEYKATVPVVTYEHPKYPTNDAFMVPIQTIEIATGTGILTKISGSYPLYDWSVNSEIATRLKPFWQWRGDFQIHITVTAAPGGSGLLGACLIPTGIDSSGEEPTAYNFCQADLYALFDLSMSKGVTFDMPWIGPFECTDPDLALNGKDPRKNWQLFIYSLCPYAHPTQTQVPVCRVFVYPLAPLEIFGLHYQAKKPATDNPILRQLTNQPEQRIMETIKKIATRPVSTGLSTLSAVAAWLGQTKEQVPYSGMSMKTFLQSEPTADGKFTGRKMNFTNHTMIQPVVNSDTQFESIANRWTLLTTALWNVSDTVSTLLDDIPISPFNIAPISESTTQYFAINGLSAAGYLGLPFQYWRGDAEYMLVFPANVYMRGKICISYNPITQTGNYSVYPEAIRRDRSVVVDIEQDKCVIIRCGFNSPTAFRDVEIVNDTVTYNSGATMGRLVLSVASKLTNTVDTGSIRVAIFVRWKNIVFTGTRNKVGFATPTVPAGVIPISLEAIKYQGAIGSEQCEEDVITLQPSQRVPDSLFTQLAASVPLDCRELCQVRSHVLQYNLAAATPVTGPTYAYNGQNAGYWSFASHYTVPFLGLTGSTRITGVTQTDGAILGVFPACGYYTSNIDLINPVMQVEYFRPETKPCYEIELPYQFPIRFALTTDPAYRGDPYSSRIALTTNVDSTWSIAINPGSDVSLFYFRFCPTIYISRATGANAETAFVGCTRTLY